MTIFSDEKKKQDVDNDVYIKEFFNLNDVKEFFPAFYNDFIRLYHLCEKKIITPVELIRNVEPIFL
jgi:hypothetical protein